MIAMQKAADYNGHLQKLSQSQQLTQGEANECKQLEAEWLVLRLTIVRPRKEVKVIQAMLIEGHRLGKRIKLVSRNTCSAMQKP